MISYQLYIIKNKQDMEEQINITVKGLCSNGNPSKEACSGICCYENAFFCNQQSCNCFKHPHCPKSSLTQLEEKLQTKLLKKTEEIQENARIIGQLFDDFIQKISLDRLKFIESMNYYGLKDYSAQLVSLIDETQYDKINGRHFALVNQQLERPNIKSLLSHEQITKYKEYLQKQFDTFRDQLRIIAAKVQEEQLQIETIDKTEFGSINFLREKIFFNYLDRRLYSVQQFLDAKQHFITIQKVNLYSANLTKIPSLLSYTSNLTTLELNYNKIVKIENLEHLTYLRFLNLGTNHIKVMENLNKLSQLRHISLFANQIKVVADIDKLFNLEVLNLNNNPLQDIDMLKLVPKLNKIYIEQCGDITKKQSSLAVLKQLQKKVLIKSEKIY